MSLVKSKQRVADHGEVFTLAWMTVSALAAVAPQAAEVSLSNRRDAP
jgi:hypothetical protein